MSTRTEEKTDEAHLLGFSALFFSISKGKEETWGILLIKSVFLENGCSEGWAACFDQKKTPTVKVYELVPKLLDRGKIISCLN